MDSGQNKAISDKEKTSELLTERVGRFALIRLPVNGFEALTLREKQLAYHLYQASLAGRDISFDQNHRLALSLRHNLNQVLAHPAGLDAGLLNSVRHYAKQVWISNGPYFVRSKRKIAPNFSLEQWQGALQNAKRQGAQLKDPENGDLAKLMFEPKFEPLVTAKSPPRGQDILTASANNYYLGVRLSDIRGFKERYPLNSRLAKRNGELVEEVWRAGRKGTADQRPAPAGLYANELKQVCKHLRTALPFATPTQADTLGHLIDYFETGESQSFDRSNIAWLRDNPRVDLILGFIESYKDARGIKGEWEGIVSIIDEDATRLMTAIADNAQYFEDRSPWDNRFKKKGVKVPVAKAIQVIVGHGGSGPSLPAGINLPNSQLIREQYGSKSFLLTNVMRAIDSAMTGLSLTEFALPKERNSGGKFARIISDIKVALHEIVGHGSGKLSKKLKGKDPAFFLKEYSNALEESRAELVMLHHIWDPRMQEIEPRCTVECTRAAYRGYVRHDLVQLRRIGGDRIEDDHMRASHLIVQYARHKGAVALKKIDGKHFQVVTDFAIMRGAVAELLAEVMRIKAEGDYSAAKALFQNYGMFFDSKIRDEVRQRAEKIGLPDYYAFIMPELTLVRDNSGRVVDVSLAMGKDFETQMKAWDRPKVAGKSGQR
jgi:dipeptidyl-peptidase-3